MPDVNLNSHFTLAKLDIYVRRPRKGIPSDPQQAIEFAQSKGQARQEGRTGIMFADVAGADSVLEELCDIVEVFH